MPLHFVSSNERSTHIAFDQDLFRHYIRYKLMTRLGWNLTRRASMAAKQTNALANTQTPKSLRNTPRLPPQQTAAELPRRTLLYKGDSAVTIGARAVALGMTAVMPSTAFLHQLMHVRIEDLQSSEWLVRLYQWMHVFNEEHLGFTIRESVPLSHLITYPSAGTNRYNIRYSCSWF